MCYHKSLVVKFQTLEEHYAAGFESINDDLEAIRERLSNLQSQQNTDESKEVVAEKKWCEKTLQGFTTDGIKRYHENGFDYLPTPVLTSGDPGQLKLMRWGLIPFYMKDKAKAFALRPQTLNCISEEMFEKPSFRDALKNGQRCLIPTTGFFEWRWQDEKGKIKTPYYIAVNNQQVTSVAGIYSRWKEPDAGSYYYSYSVLTTQANSVMEFVHNSKKRMPVIIPRQFERDWLNKDLSKDDVLALCQPFVSEEMSHYTISKLITTKNVETNVEEVLQIHEYDKLNSQ